MTLQQWNTLNDEGKYSKINSTNSPASGATKINEPTMTKQVARMREIMWAEIIAFLQPERWRCQYSSADVTDVIT
jgi:copper(I)-binding protein